MRQDGFRRVVLEFPDERGGSFDAVDLYEQDGHIEEAEADYLLDILDEAELPITLSVDHSRILLRSFANALQVGDFGLAPQQRANIGYWLSGLEPIN